MKKETYERKVGFTEYCNNGTINDTYERLRLGPVMQRKRRFMNLAEPAYNSAQFDAAECRLEMFYGFNPCLAESKFLGSQEKQSHPLSPRTTHYCSTINFTNFSSPPLRSYPELSAQNSGHEYELPLPAFRGGPEMIVIKRARERGGYEKGLDESSNQE